jgi:diacylglycerol kinase (ATP)
MRAPKKKSVRVLMNPNAGSSHKRRQLKDALAALADLGWKVSLRETASAEDAIALARDAAQSNFDFVAAAGGDGAIHSILHGMMQVWEELAAKSGLSGSKPLRTGLAVIPMGTGNDLARTLGLPLDVEQAVAAIADLRMRSLDVIRIQAEEHREYLINVAAGGNSGAVAEAMTEELKQAWGAWCYVRGALDVLTDLQPYRVELDLDGRRVGPLEALNVVLANGRTVAGGVRVAPRANPEDGLLDVVIVQYASLLETASVAAEFFLGDYLEHESVLFDRARRVELISEPPITFSADGELITGHRFVFEMLQSAIPVVIGPEYSAEPLAAGAAG